MLDLHRLTYCLVRDVHLFRAGDSSELHRSKPTVMIWILRVGPAIYKEGVCYALAAFETTL
jgi:hypothetical protein